MDTIRTVEQIVVECSPSEKRDLELHLTELRENMLRHWIAEDEKAARNEEYMDYIRVEEPEEYNRLLKLK